MKTAILTAILATLLLLTGCTRAATPHSAQLPSEPNTPQQETAILHATPSPDLLTEMEALEIAFSHAGVSPDEAGFVFAEFEIDDGIPVYDVSFYVSGVEYEYEIHADTGKILSFERDR